jgi:hypothetical protein
MLSHSPLFIALLCWLNAIGLKIADFYSKTINGGTQQKLESGPPKSKVEQQPQLTPQLELSFLPSNL